jgi:hypothetical protein
MSGTWNVSNNNFVWQKLIKLLPILQKVNLNWLLCTKNETIKLMITYFHTVLHFHNVNTCTFTAVNILQKGWKWFLEQPVGNIIEDDSHGVLKHYDSFIH